MLDNDLAFGLYKAAKYYYYPGWHEPGTAIDAFINLDAWNDLPKDLQAVVDHRQGNSRVRQAGCQQQETDKIELHARFSGWSSQDCHHRLEEINSMPGKSFRTTVVLFLLFLGACREMEVKEGVQAPAYQVVLPEGASTRNLQELLAELAGKRVIYVGETHSRYGHHLLQLEVIRGLYERGVDLVIGMEFFQKPFQKWLDAWIAGEISEAEMLEKTQWYDRWRFDYRLYRPILRFAREHRIPVIALNIPRELTEQVSEKGIDGLEKAERAQLPAEIDRSDQAYRERLHKAFSRHQGREESQFERFLDVQYSWDEGMAQSVADYLERHPEKTMVVLAGSGHIAYGSGIPNRVARRIGGDYIIILPATGKEDVPEMADYLVAVERKKLPPRALMGVMIGSSGKGVKVEGVTPGSGAQQAGLRKGDLLLAIDGEPVSSLAEIRVRLLDKHPGDRIKVRFERDGEVQEKTLALGKASPH